MRVNILGPIEAELDEQRIELGGEKQQSVLLALVLAEGKVLGTDRLIDLVWGDRPPAKPNVTLRSYISHLRKVLEPGHRRGNGPQLLVTKSGGYAFEVSADQVDAFLFRQLAEQARTAAANGELSVAVTCANEGLSLWRTQSLIHGPMKAFVGDAESLTEARNQLVETKLRSLLGLGQHREAIDQARHLIVQHPYNQALREILMVALYACGRGVEALNEYQIIRRLLADELGLEPGPLLQRLEHQILDNDVSLLGTPEPVHTHTTTPTEDQATPPSTHEHLGLVGRDEELQKLDQFLAGPGGQIAAITGEPGIGKTTLANHIADTAATVGQFTTWGRCHDGAQMHAYWPWSTALRDLLEPLDDSSFSKVIGSRSADLGPLLTTISRTTTPRQADASGGSVALYDAVTQLLIRRAQIGQCLLVFEDLHWSDIGSLKLLNFAIPALKGHAIRIVATWRTTERSGPELAGELADLARLAGSTRLPLAGLSANAVGQLYRHTRHEASPAGLDVELRERTDGNPFFVTELLRSADPSVAVSGVPTIAEAIERRISALPAGSKEALRIGALCPVGFRESLLTAVLDADHEGILDRIEDAMAARILEEDPAANSGFRFTHSLIAEQLTNGLAPSRRASYHARIGNVLSDSGGTTSQLAYHYLRGANAGTALLGAQYALRAGQNAIKLFDHSGAAKLFEDGLASLSIAEKNPNNQPWGPSGSPAANTDSVDSTDSPDSTDSLDSTDSPDSTDSLDSTDSVSQAAPEPDSACLDHALLSVRADLLVELAQAAKNLEQYERTHALAQESFDAALHLGDPIRMLDAAQVFAGQAHLSDGSFTRQWLGYWSPPAPARTMFSACIDRLEEGDPLRVVAMMGYSASCYDVPDDAKAKSIVDLAIAEARSHHDDTLVADTILNKLQTRQRSLSVHERHALSQEAIEVAQRVKNLDLEITARNNSVVVSLDRGRPAEAIEGVSRIADIGRQTEAPLLKLWAESMDISLAIFQGRFPEAEERLQIAFVEYAKYGSAAVDVFGLQLSTLYREIGKTDEVLDMMKWKLEGYPGAAFAAPIAAVYAETGRVEQAQAVIDEHYSEALFGGGENILQFVTPTLYSEVLVQQDNAVASHRLYQALLPAENRIVAMLYAAIVIGSGSLPLGRLATVLGKLDVARAHLGHAQRLHNELKSRPYQLRTTAAFAVLAASQGDQSEINRLVDEAEHLAEDLGMQWLTSTLTTTVEHTLSHSVNGTRGY